MANKHYAYDKGYKVFKQNVLPKSCPYLNDSEDISEEIIDWMNGWSDAFNDFFGSFS